MAVLSRDNDILKRRVVSPRVNIAMSAADIAADIAAEIAAEIAAIVTFPFSANNYDIAVNVSYH